MARNVFLLIFIMFIDSAGVLAQDKLKVGTQKQSDVIDFSKFYGLFLSHSKHFLSEQIQLENVQLQKQRAERHWYPRLMLDAKAFRTNDPGTILFSKLGERAISGEDMNPIVMNFPVWQNHEKTSLILDLPIYEGQIHRVQTSALEVAEESQEKKIKAVKVQELSRAMGYYGQLIILKNKEKELLPLVEIVESTIKRYAIGSQANPLGYSGLLGLKNLKNRLTGEMSMLQAQREALLASLESLTGLAPTWSPLENNVSALIQENVSELTKNQQLESFSVQAMSLYSQSLELAAEGEKSRFHPRIGAFFDQSFYNSQETHFANSQNMGVYLQWELFNAKNFDGYREKLLLAHTQKQKTLAMKIDQNNQMNEKIKAVAALKKQIQLAEQSLQLLEEQTSVTRRLFNNGLINALQLAEVYNRRVEVISIKSQMEENILKSQAELMNYIPLEMK